MQLKKYYIVLMLAGVVITSCKKSDLFEQPLDAVSAATAFSTPDRIDKSATGMYAAMQNPNWTCGRHLIYCDLMGLDANPAPYFAQVGYFDKMNANDGIVSAAWTAAYNTIYVTNLFVKSFAAVQSMVPAAKASQYFGEASFIRAYNYFYMINFWGKSYLDPAGPTNNPGVPLVLTATENAFDASNFIPRSTVKQVYDQIEKDLLDAEQKLPLNYPGDSYTTVSRATKGAARAMLMRLYLYEGQWAKAITYADLVINSGLYKLNATPEVAFRNYTTQESIFSVAFSGSNNPGRNNALAAHYYPGIRNDITVSQSYLSLMDTTVDLRYKNLILKSNNLFWSNKYVSFSDWAPLIRYSEVLLVKAEALARLSSAVVDPAALGLLNQVRARSKASIVVAATPQSLIDAILKERRIELAFEGQSYFDFQRNLLDLPAHTTVTAQPYGTNFRVWPIPLRDINIMPTLVQNPGY
ncbi:RagB/SusD family nutrient uptake outer membrane protein [Mucilaginibacter sp.]|uniref:RagB/SusD family nutrient uptake outer membrane protein n=1 Tax=Mucilaginibacter sp. TaxID=1882438 RepID=UPI0026342410|nr:RagB/SusD family nutrient uptake outer membrane protein [Mucilaginibacter sp.]MDB5031703.1 RagB/SusD family nutrient uptake outer membrane protein [Mucilaginibacter sp.]